MGEYSMKRKSFAAMCIMTACFAMTACGNSSQNTTAGGVNNESQMENGSKYVFETSGYSVKVNAKISECLEKLGEPKGGTYEVKSCAFDGMDKFYYYGAYTIQGYQKDNEDLVYSVTFMDDTVKTKEGVRLGDSKDKMTSAYGSSFNQDGEQYIYTSGNTKLIFVIKNDVIENIMYELNQ